jgi:DNA repair exonuclease SbcCD ATPase subunit
MAFSFDEEKGFAPNEVLVEVTSSYEPSAEPQFALEAIEAYKKAQGKNDEEDNSNSQESTEEEEEICPVCGKPVSECTCEEDEEEKKTKHSLEELQTSFAELKKSYDVLRAENAELIQFKNKVERKEKEDMIASFVMLSDEDKQDVVTNIDKYSLDDIEAKLSVICVRNKVSFNLDEDSNLPGGATTYSLTDCEDSATPAWVKRALAVAKTLED